MYNDLYDNASNVRKEHQTDFSARSIHFIRYILLGPASYLYNSRYAALGVWLAEAAWDLKEQVCISPSLFRTRAARSPGAVLYWTYGLSCGKLNVTHMWVHTVFLVILPKLHALSGDCFPFTESRSEENLNRPWYNYCAFPSPSPALPAPQPDAWGIQPTILQKI